MLKDGIPPNETSPRPIPLLRHNELQDRVAHEHGSALEIARPLRHAFLSDCLHGSLVVTEEKDRSDDGAIEEVQYYAHPNGGLGQARLLGSLGFGRTISDDFHRFRRIRNCAVGTH